MSKKQEHDGGSGFVVVKLESWQSRNEYVYRLDGKIMTGVYKTEQEAEVARIRVIKDEILAFLSQCSIDIRDEKIEPYLSLKSEDQYEWKTEKDVPDLMAVEFFEENIAWGIDDPSGFERCKIVVSPMGIVKK
jgi:hypothetical protein